MNVPSKYGHATTKKKSVATISQAKNPPPPDPPRHDVPAEKGPTPIPTPRFEMPPRTPKAPPPIPSRMGGSRLARDAVVVAIPTRPVVRVALRNIPPPVLMGLGAVGVRPVCS